MSAGELRALTKQRRQVTAAVTQQARHLAAEAGHKVTQAVADQVEATLTAAMVDADCGRAVRSGLLVAPLQTTGVDAVGEAALAAALALPEALGFSATAREAPEPGPPSLRVVPDPDAGAKARAAARGASRPGRRRRTTKPTRRTPRPSPTSTGCRPGRSSCRPRSTSCGAGWPTSRPSSTRSTTSSVTRRTSGTRRPPRCGRRPPSATRRRPPSTS